jgi:DNA-binding IclR family transcriptional regulator
MVVLSAKECGRASSGASIVKPVKMDGKLDQKSVVASVLKALEILECFTSETPELTVLQVQSLTGYNVTTCHRLLATMMKAGWLARGQGASYRLTFKLLRVGSAVVNTSELRVEAHSILSDLVDHFEDTGYLMVPDGNRALCLDRIEGDYPVRVSAVEVGTTLPLNSGGAPLTILAWREDLIVSVLNAPLEIMTDKTIDDDTTLRARLDEVRRNGYAFSQDDVLPDVCAVGAPVFDAEGLVIGAISIGGVSSRFASARKEEISIAVMDAARRLSFALGWNGTAQFGVVPKSSST